MIKSGTTWGDLDVNTAKSSIQNLIEQWELAFTKWDKFALQLDDKEIWENVNGFTSAAGQVYKDFNQFMDTIRKRERVILSDAHSRWKEIEDEALMAYKEKSIEKHTKILMKCVEVAQDAKFGWDIMRASIEGVCGAYSLDPRFMYGGPLSLKQLDAYQFCYNAIEAVRADCAMRYNSCFKEMEQLE